MQMYQVEFKNVSFAYPGNHLAVDNISLQIAKGENIAIIGQNGAGKTTTVKMMNGLLKPTSGDVLIDGKNTKDYTTAQMSHYVGYVFQNPDDQIFHSTVGSEVSFGPQALGFEPSKAEELVDTALQITNMEQFKDENPYNLPLSIRKFVTIAAIIAMDTDVMIFDEPTAGQDLEGTLLLGEILKNLKAKGKTLITISHDMEFVAANFDRVYVMATKHVLGCGTASEVFWNFNMLEKAMLKQPHVSHICRELGINGDIIHISDAVEAIIKQ